MLTFSLLTSLMTQWRSLVILDFKFKTMSVTSTMTYGSGPRVIQESHYSMTYIRTFATQRYIHVYKIKRDCWPLLVILEWSSRCLFRNTLIYNHLDWIQMEEVISEHNAHRSTPLTQQWLKKYTTQMKSDMINTANLDSADKFSPTTTANELKKQALPQGKMSQKVSWGPLLFHISRILCPHHYPTISFPIWIFMKCIRWIRSTTYAWKYTLSVFEEKIPKYHEATFGLNWALTCSVCCPLAIGLTFLLEQDLKLHILSGSKICQNDDRQDTMRASSIKEHEEPGTNRVK